MPGDPGKLLVIASARDRPVLGAPRCARGPTVRLVGWEALPARASPAIGVVRHERAEVEKALAGFPVQLVHNPDFAQGLGASLRAGIAAVPADADGAIVCLGDMPQVDAALIDRLIGAFDPERGALAGGPSSDGKRGRPGVSSRRLCPDLAAHGVA